MMPTEVHLPTASDVATIRHGLGLSQAEFSALLGISTGTLQGWEALRREPDGPARVLLLIAKYQPKAIRKAFAMAIANQTA